MGIHRRWVVAIAIVMAACLAASVAAEAAEAPWPAEVPGFRPVEPGEHPRLLFRRTELPALRARAGTPEGRAILQRLRVTLNGADGRSLPAEWGINQRPTEDGAGPLADAPDGAVLTISHVAGHGLLYQVTGEKRYADLGRQAMEKQLEGYRGRDRRYSLIAPGALRAGPSLGWAAVGYDLCYDGWEPGFREKVAEFLATYDQGSFCTLEELVRGARHAPASNHWGMQVGGGAMALLAVMHDPGVDMQKIGPLLEASQRSMIRNVTEGFGDGGYFAEGDGCGTMASHIIYLPAIQAWKTAGGKDFITPRPNVRWTALRWFLLTVPRGDNMANLHDGMVVRGGYPHNVWARSGLSGGGYFGIGYGVVTPEERAGVWWWYNRHVRAWDEKNATPFDTISHYPHHSVLAFLNTPFDQKPVNPAEVMPRNVRDARHQFYAFRNRWQDDHDIVITQLAARSPYRFVHGPDAAMTIQYAGRRMTWGSIPRDATHWRPAADGSAVVGNGKTCVAIDFSGASGADAMLVMTGPGSPGGATVAAGARTYSFLFLTQRDAPTPKADGDRVVVGEQTVAWDGENIVLGRMAGPWGAGQ
jgi:hypothetical protein